MKRDWKTWTLQKFIIIICSEARFYSTSDWSSAYELILLKLHVSCVSLLGFIQNGDLIDLTNSMWIRPFWLNAQYFRIFHPNSIKQLVAEEAQPVTVLFLFQFTPKLKQPKIKTGMTGYDEGRQRMGITSGKPNVNNNRNIIHMRNKANSGPGMRIFCTSCFLYLKSYSLPVNLSNYLKNPILFFIFSNSFFCNIASEGPCQLLKNWSNRVLVLFFVLLLFAYLDGLFSIAQAKS